LASRHDARAPSAVHGLLGQRTRIQRFSASTNHGSNRATLITQFDVPVRKINEVLPEIVLRCGKRNLHKRAPLWSLRFADQAQVRFTRDTIALSGITGYARANDVFPGCHASAVARHDVVQIKIASIKHLAAVLAGVLVPLEYIVTREFHFFLRQPIEHEQHDHPRDPNPERNRGDQFMVRRARRQVAPAFEIVR
jgi:hypothetical protein